MRLVEADATDAPEDKDDAEPIEQVFPMLYHGTSSKHIPGILKAGGLDGPSH
jgi:hypothetical protein